MNYSPEILAAAEHHYMTVGRRVSGRPTWAKLDPNCSYDMGMRQHAIDEATKAAAAVPHAPPLRKTGAELASIMGLPVTAIEKMYRRGCPVVGDRGGKPFASHRFDLPAVLDWFAERDGRDPRAGDAA